MSNSMDTCKEHGDEVIVVYQEYYYYPDGCPICKEIKELKEKVDDLLRENSEADNE